MDFGSGESQRARMRELLSRLDRVATVSRGHRAGLHLDDRALFDKYLATLIAWENQLQGQLQGSQSQSQAPASAPATSTQHERPALSVSVRSG
jgi:hypothetical protein